LGLD
jgi:hypothetical protein